MAENTGNKAANASANSAGNANSAGKAGNSGNKSSLFREKNLERLESPEKLNDYLRVTSPGVWGRIQATRQAVVITESGESTCLVPESAMQGVLQYRTIEIDGEDKELVPDVLEPQVISDSTNVYVMLAGGLRVGDIVYPISLAESLKTDGIVTGRQSP